MIENNRVRCLSRQICHWFANCWGTRGKSVSSAVANTSRWSRKRTDVGDRRASQRFEMALNLRYAVQGRDHPSQTCVGQAVNMSSTGMLFRTESKLAPGEYVTAALEWPLAASESPLFLVLTGFIVRSKGLTAAMSISSHELMPARALRARKAILPPIVLIDEDEQSSAIISAILAPQYYSIQQVDANSAKEILVRGFPPVSLLITRTPDLAGYADPQTRIIVTVPEEGGEGIRASIAARPSLVVVQKPLIYGAVRAAIFRGAQAATNAE